MNAPYETHACVICGCTKFVSGADNVYRTVEYEGGHTREYNNLEACTLCGTVRDKNIVNKRYKEKHHESTDER